MSVKAEAWDLAEDWTGVREAAEAIGCTRATASRMMRVLVSEGVMEKRFVDGRGDEFRRVEGSLRPQAPSETKAGTMAVLALGPMTTNGLAEKVGVTPGAMRMALGRYEKAGLVVRLPGSEPAVWRLARWD